MQANMNHSLKMAQVIAANIIAEVVKAHDEVTGGNLTGSHTGIPPGFTLNPKAHRKLLAGDILDQSLNKISGYADKNFIQKDAIKGAVIGAAVVGSIAGVVSTFQLCHSTECCDTEPLLNHTGRNIALAALGAGIGAGIGAAVGKAQHP